MISTYYDAMGLPNVIYSQNVAGTYTDIKSVYYDSMGHKTYDGIRDYSTSFYKNSKSWVYDAADRAKEEWTHYSFTKNPASGGVLCWTCDSVRMFYEYDANGNRTKMYDDMQGSRFTTEYAYDALNRMTGVTFNGGSAQYTYDTLGRRTKTAYGNGTYTEYSYEVDSDLDWMRHVFNGGATATAANDNWVGVDYGYDKTHMLTAKGVTDSRIMAGLPNVGTYGAANNLNQVSVVPGRGAMTWSDAGNLNNDGKGTTYVHNALQQLIKATKADGTTYDFRYDGDGLMVEAVKNATGINDVFQFIGGLKTRYVTSATEEVAELDGNRVVTKRFIAGPAIDERVAQIDANNAVKYIHGDRQNSVIALTNATGNPILRRAYGEYGETDATQMAQEGHPFGYTGRRWFTDLGLYYYRARWYDPDLGTFLETDPIGELDYINLYSYVGLNPLNATDPSGMCPVCISAGVGAGVSAAVEATGQLIESGKVNDWGAVGNEAAIGAAAGLVGFGAGKFVASAIPKGVIVGASSSGAQDAIKQTTKGNGSFDAKQSAAAVTTGAIFGGLGSKAANEAKKAAQKAYSNSAPNGFKKGSLANKLAQNGVITKPPHSKVGNNSAAAVGTALTASPDAVNRVKESKCNTWFGLIKC